MKVLVLNCGSSSIKYKLFDMGSQSVLAQGGIEKIGLPDAFLQVKLSDGSKRKITAPIPEHTVGIKMVLDALTDKEIGCLKSLTEIDAVGHRVVHGGEAFSQSVKITPDVIEQIERCIDIAPLHNPANLKGISAISKVLPSVPQVAVFDTAFHQTMPEYAYMYALPYDYYEKYGVRRYGFHGTSHRYVSQRAYEFLHLDPRHSKLITAHIGNGGSCTAILDGKSIDTSMGLTPVEGLMMGTRCGDVDAGALAFLINKEHLSGDALNDLINKRSGLQGVSGVSSDARDIAQAVSDGNHRADLARKMYIYRVKKYIGAYMAVLNGLDALVFTAGVGENDGYIRAEICKDLECFGIEIDREKCLGSRGEEIILSTPQSKVLVAVIPTDEEWMIASDTKCLIKN